MKQPLKSGVGGRKEVTGPQITLSDSAPQHHRIPQIMFLSTPFTGSFPLPPLPFHLGGGTGFQLTQLH